jgi:hypothetical protein
VWVRGFPASAPLRVPDNAAEAILIRDLPLEDV